MTSTLAAAAQLVIHARQGHGSIDDALQHLEAALTAHEQRDGFAETCWSIDDLRSLRPDWSDAQLRDWLAEHESALQSALVEFGWDALAELLSEDHALS